MIVVWLASLCSALVWFALGVWRYRIFRSSVDDGTFTQIMLSAYDGFRSAQEQFVNHLVAHFSPIYFVLAPGVIATHSTLTLTAYQAVATALVGPPVYLIARKRMPEAPAVLCALVALAYPPLAGVTFSDFFESGLEPAAILWLVWALDAGKIRLSYVLGVIALCIKEDVAPGIFFAGTLGGLWLLRHGDERRARAAFGLAALAVVVFVGYFFLMRPVVFHTPMYSIYDQRFYSNGGAPRPLLFSGATLRYLWAILYPLLGLPLLSPAIVFTLPGLLEVLLSSNPVTISLETHYTAVWIGYMLFAFVLGIARVIRERPRLSLALPSAVLCVALLDLIVADPAARWYYLYRLPNGHDAALQSLIDSLPKETDVGADEQIFSHLGLYPKANVSIDHGYVIVDTTQHIDSQAWLPEQQRLEELVRAGRYRAVRSEDGIVLYERVQ